MLTLWQTINHGHSTRHARKKVLSSASGTSATRVDVAGARPELAELPSTSAMRLDDVTWAPVLAELPPVWAPARSILSRSTRCQRIGSSNCGVGLCDPVSFQNVLPVVGLLEVLPARKQICFPVDRAHLNTCARMQL